MITIVFDAVYSPSTVRVLFAYNKEIIAAVKTLPTAHWSPTSKVWTISTGVLSLIRPVLGGRWDISWIGIQEPDHQSFGATWFMASAGGGADTGTWASLLFTAVGPTRSTAVFRALSKVLHPDSPTGDTTLMRQLLEAREERQHQSAA